MEKLSKINKITVGIVGIVFGALIILAVRFATYKPVAAVHYHANFAVYIDGKQEQFENPFLYEEISECSVRTSMTPGERAHLHDKVKDVVHVEDEAVTWGNFFQNIGWGVGNDYLATSDTMHLDIDAKKVSYILNGESLDNITNKIIGNKDRLLVNYGESTTEQLKQQFDSVPSTAEKYNVEKDPASCGGGHAEDSLKDRMKHLF